MQKLSDTQTYFLFTTTFSIFLDEEANLSSGQKLALGAVMMGPRGSLLLLAWISPMQKICLAQGNLSQWGTLMESVQCSATDEGSGGAVLFCWRLLYFIISHRTVSWQRKPRKIHGVCITTHVNKGLQLYIVQYITLYQTGVLFTRNYITQLQCGPFSLSSYLSFNPYVYFQNKFERR